MTWWEQAQCKGADEDAVVPTKGRDGDARAKATCGPCPVTDECLADAMLHEAGPASCRFGIRGGLTPKERADLAQGAQPKPAPRREYQPRQYQQRPVQRPAPSKPVSHGRGGYVNRGCRCDVCRAANTAYQRVLRQRRAGVPV